MTKRMPTVHEIAIAGLLHDIGKLVQRARPGAMPKTLMDRATDVLPSYKGRFSHWHALWSDWVFDLCETGDLYWPAGTDRAWVRNLAVYHHKPLQDYRMQPELVLSHLVTVADRMAAGFERKARDAEAEAAWSESGPTRERFRRTPIDAITSRVRLQGVSGEATGGRFHFPRELSPEALVPTGQPLGSDIETGYASLWEGYRKAWNDAARRCKDDPGAFEEAILSLSERFLWAVPSSTTDQPDISLHDHSRAVAAFAAALFRFHEAAGSLEQPDALSDGSSSSLRVLVGDLSGLQSTLFRLGSEQVKGINKTLRGRSMRFQLIADAASRQALDAFGMPVSATLQSAGGRFLLVVPALMDAEDRLQNLRNSFDRWCVDQYSGDLSVGLSLSDPFAPNDLIARENEEDGSDAERVRASLSIATETAKLGLLAAQAEYGVVDVVFADPGACGTCNVRPARADGLCDACDAERRLGAALPRSRAVIVRAAGSDADHADRLFSREYRLVLGEGADRHDRGTGWRWMRDAPVHGPAPLRAGPAWVAKFGEDRDRYSDLMDADEAMEPGDIKTFQALARDACEPVGEGRSGREMLALIKGDVDRLGRVFADGLGGDWSIARAAALSRMIDAYFSLRLPWLLQEKSSDSYTVYAGGDDFMLVLPWRQGFDLAEDLRRDFDAFTGWNPSLTFSMGIALFDPRTPISIAAREAEERLETAKAAGRNRISVMESDPMTWEEFSDALSRARILNELLRNKMDSGLSTALLYRLLGLDDARRRIAEGKARPADVTWMARLGYQLFRNIKDPDIQQMLRSLFGLDETWRGGSDIKPGARLSICHALYRNR